MKKKKFDKLGKEKVRGLKRARREGLRIVAKAILYNKQGEILCFSGSEDRGGARKPNFPGGGRNKGERLWQTLKREVTEETSYKMTNLQAQNAVVLRRGKVVTTRPGYDFKYLVLCAQVCEDLEAVRAVEEIDNPQVFASIEEVMIWMKSEEVVLDPSVRSFYISALKKLQKIIG